MREVEREEAGGVMAPPLVVDEVEHEHKGVLSDGKGSLMRRLSMEICNP